jgi:hypothetical protein
MSTIEFDESMCGECGQPLFLSKEECKEFIEKKMKQGYIVCKCCGSREDIEKTD